MDVNWLQACLLADAAADLGDTAAAAYLHDRLEPYADLFAVIARGAGCYCSTELYLGRLAATLGRLDEAEARLRRAVAVNEAAGSPDVRRDLRCCDSAASSPSAATRRARATCSPRPSPARRPSRCRRWRPRPPPHAR